MRQWKLFFLACIFSRWTTSYIKRLRASFNSHARLILKAKLEPANSNSFQKVLESLESSSFVKIICGASNQDVSMIRNLCFICTICGCDCIDLSADIAVIQSAMQGIESAVAYMKKTKPITAVPIMMISVNDYEDPHFRKAYFNTTTCPPDCDRPCERVCPAWAIPSSGYLKQINSTEGVINEKCYGCGRCIPTCPYGLIEVNSYVVGTDTINSLFDSSLVQAIEIHTLPGHLDYFRKIWNSISHSVLLKAQIIAISFPDMGEDTVSYLTELQTIMEGSDNWVLFNGVQVWQTDGRPMSGDIGKGTARASCQLASKIIKEINRSQEGEFRIGWTEASLHAKQFLQLAGGTNNYSFAVADELGLLTAPGFGGFAFGGYSMSSMLGRLLREIEEDAPGARVEEYPDTLHKCIDFASSFIRTIKMNS